MESFPSEKKIDLHLFKDSHQLEVEEFLEDGKINLMDFLNLAYAVSVCPDELYSRYHNFFSFKKENSIEYLYSFIENDKIKLNGFAKEQSEIERVENRIKITIAFIEFVKKYGWEQGFNVVNLLENSLKQ